MIEPPQGPIPREVAKWLDSLDLAYQVRNFRRDLANGFIVAEILSRYYPKEVNIYTVYNEQNLDKKRDNWEQISKLLKKKELQVPQEEYEPIFHQAPDAAQAFLFKLYEFLTKKKIGTIYPDKDNRDMKKQVKQQATLQRTKPLSVQPTYARPTANTIIKDREITRVIDENERKMLTKQAIEEHVEKVRNDKKDDNIIEYLILKRKKQIEEEIKKQEEELLKKQMKFNKKLVNLDQSISQTGQDVKEIQINCYHSSTSKKAKEQQGQLLETKGVIDFLHEACASLFKKDPIKKDIQDLKLEPKESQQNNGYQVSNQNVQYTAVIQQLFLRCDEVQKKSLKLLLTQFIDVHSQLILEQVQSNFIDFKRFFQIFLRPIQVLKPTSKTYQYILELIRFIGSKLVEIDPNDTQMMFESILLDQLLQIALRNPKKREDIVQLFFVFTPINCVNRTQLLKSIKSKLSTDLNAFTLILSILIQSDYPSQDEELYRFFLNYAFNSLDSPSPLTRANGLRIINQISSWDYFPVLQKINRIQRLMNDSWWEVRAQGMCICADLLLQIAQNSNRSMDEQEITIDFEQSKQLLLDLIYQVFVVSTTPNVIRIGLIYLAPVLQMYSELCPRYLEILLSVDSEIRISVLNTQETLIQQVVNGCNSFRYKITGAPIDWNSVGIAQAMDVYVKEKDLQFFKHEHLEIIYGCLHKQLLESDGEIWLKIFENTKRLLFLALSNEDLCSLAQVILQKFFMFQTIQQQVLDNSNEIFQKMLQLIYHPDVHLKCKENLLEFFAFLQQQGFQNYCYNIIKQFSEKQKNMFLSSNLVEFMNSLAKEKRREILGDENY
ncbi:unnamed protein product [Paramecium pentaurelia]|uniref:Calponin-homology (CH) domain-containing protein n=1 Tax=Paramecium pentaurelia TaxID=43138 RepID=A0A8S1W5R2_9CILI|nr:unnamed protein product [Paramecium pentaurelia]